MASACDGNRDQDVECWDKPCGKHRTARVRRTMNRAPMADRTHGAVPRSASRDPAPHGRPSATTRRTTQGIQLVIYSGGRLAYYCLSSLVLFAVVAFAIIFRIERLEPTRAPRRGPV